MSEIKKLIESLNPNERKIIPLLEDNNVEKIIQKTGMDKTSVLRALEFLSNKNIIKIQQIKEIIVDLGINGILYKKNGLPERRLINLLFSKKISINNIKKETNLNDNEIKAAIGVLKKKNFIDISNGEISLIEKKQEIVEKTEEEKFLDGLPKKIEELKENEKIIFNDLKSRKNIIEINEKKITNYSITKIGEEIIKSNLEKNMVEALTPNMIKSGNWKGKKFRRYDLKNRVPRIYGGKRHFVNQAIDYAKKIWLEMGFKEMDGSYCQSSFWNFDALFTAQDHPVREMQDTFFIDKKSDLPKKIVERVKRAHEIGVDGSKGWDYEWKEEEAKKVVLRTHTTCLSIQKLVEIAKNKEIPAKYFAIGKCFRNETVDWSHGFEFNQTEGIVIDKNANFRQLLGYLIEFFKKMGYKKIRIRPGYFPYTEPSLEIDVFHPKYKKWIELGGAGMFRPEVTVPIFGKHVPVLAWGPGFDRIIMEFFKIEDLREMYKNDLNKLREMKIWDR